MTRPSRFSTALYILGFPNHEVEHAFLRYLADAYTPVPKEQAAVHLVRLQQAAD